VFEEDEYCQRAFARNFSSIGDPSASLLRLRAEVKAEDF
jgi:hypothetical protein